MEKDDGADSLVRSDALLGALKKYRCNYSADECGAPLMLVDVLSPYDTIAEGEKELRLLSDYLAEVFAPN